MKKIKITLKNPKGKMVTKEVSPSYLVKFVNPEQMYDVSYLASHQSPSGKREQGVFTLKGEDLTENQIAELFSNELL